MREIGPRSQPPVGRTPRDDPVAGNPDDIVDFERIRTHHTVDRAHHDMVILVLDEAAHIVRGTIGERADALQIRSRDAQLLTDTALRSRYQILSRTRMRTATVRPYAGEVVLARASPLEDETSVGPEQDDRHRTVKDAGRLVRGHLPHPAATYTGPVHQLDLDLSLFTHHHETAITDNIARGLPDPKEPQTGTDLHMRGIAFDRKLTWLIPLYTVNTPPAS